MKILVINCGSSTLKFQVVHAENGAREWSATAFSSG